MMPIPAGTNGLSPVESPKDFGEFWRAWPEQRCRDRGRVGAGQSLLMGWVGCWVAVP